MYNIGIAFNILEDDEYLPPGFNKSCGRLIFDVKIDFTSKAWWVKDVHRTPYSRSSSHAGANFRIKVTQSTLLQVTRWKKLSHLIFQRQWVVDSRLVVLWMLIMLLNH